MTSEAMTSDAPTTAGPTTLTYAEQYHPAWVAEVLDLAAAVS